MYMQSIMFKKLFHTEIFNLTFSVLQARVMLDFNPSDRFQPEKKNFQSLFYFIYLFIFYLFIFFLYYFIQTYRRFQQSFSHSNWPPTSDLLLNKSLLELIYFWISAFSAKDQ